MLYKRNNNQVETIANVILVHFNGLLYLSHEIHFMASTW
jgi:hypothetical protein